MQSDAGDGVWMWVWVCVSASVRARPRERGKRKQQTPSRLIRLVPSKKECWKPRLGVRGRTIVSLCVVCVVGLCIAYTLPSMG